MQSAFLRMGVIAAFIALIGFATAVHAQEGTDKQNDGTFTGLAVVTSDVNWFEIFSRPETPHFQGQDTFGTGDRGAVAILFSNAEPENGIVEIEYDITNFDPEGSKVIVKGGKCYEGPYLGDNVLHPSLLDLQFQISESDPVGRAGFEIVLRDVHSGRTVALKVAFNQGTGT